MYWTRPLLAGNNCFMWRLWVGWLWRMAACCRLYTVAFFGQELMCITSDACMAPTMSACRMLESLTTMQNAQHGRKYGPLQP
jgi:hypothetical protein